MKLTYSPIAEIELRQAVDFYNKERSGLGFEFLARIKESAEKIVDFPNAWKKISKNSRVCNLRGYPYSLIYHKMKEEILIIAVMHNSKDPESWENRI